MAEPKPAEKANLAAVPEPKPGAAPKPAQTPKAAPAAAKASPAAAPARQKKQQGTRWGLWLLVVLFLAAGVFGWYQTQQLTAAEGRITALSEQVLGLEAQLAAANLQIHTYEMQQQQVREAVSDLSQRILLLGELVGGPAEVSPPAEPEPAPQTP